MVPRRSKLGAEKMFNEYKRETSNFVSSSYKRLVLKLMTPMRAGSQEGPVSKTMCDIQY